MVLSSKDLLRQLVQIPSVNPAFQASDSSICGESRLTDFLEIFFRNLHIPTVRQQVHPGRDNLIAVIRGQDSSPKSGTILWEVHQDTVGIQGMKIAPFDAVESDGRIWGRGAADVKGAMAAMLAAAGRIYADSVALQHTIVLAFTINEECGFSGVKAFARLWGDLEQGSAEVGELRGALSLEEIRELRPSRAIVAEPTLLDVVVAHKGCIRWRCHTHGKAAHTSSPEQGVNAISTMLRVVQSIERYQLDVLGACQPHALCDRPTVVVSTIQGGSGVNTVPDHAVIDIDHRLMPGDDPEVARDALIAYLAAALPNDAPAIEHEAPSNQCLGLLDDCNRDWAQQITATVDAVQSNLPVQSNEPSRPSQLVGVPFGTDAWVIAKLGIPTVVFGPGSIEQAHTDDEWINVDQLRSAEEVFYRLAVSA